MKVELVQFACVVTGEHHNPTILNPDFLRIRGIVPESWGWTPVEPATVTTLPFAAVRFTNGVAITVEPGKLQVADAAPNGGIDKSRIVDIASKYVATLPHVKYRAVGNNFRFVVEVPAPDALLRDRFLKDGTWNNVSHPVRGINLRLAYPLDNGRLILSLGGAEADRQPGNEAGRQTVLIADVNCHRDISDYPGDAAARAFLARAAADRSACAGLLRDVLGD